MCGITGYIDRKTKAGHKEIIESMTASLIHRGPDGHGTCIFECPPDFTAAFGHRRLSILDLSPRGAQPMWSHDGRCCITYNGEIYNYLELKKELENQGHVFSTRTDTEVILAAYQQYSTDCFKKFNGMWALALHDTSERRFILSRDRMGKKPLYYYCISEAFVFGSEPKALFRHPSVQSEPDYQKVYRYLSGNYRYIDNDASTYYRNMKQVPGGSFLVVDYNLNQKQQKYWTLAVQEPFSRPESELIDEFRSLLIDSVRLRLRSDVPVGCFLSGGMDSTSITCIAYKVLKQPIKTFSGITGEEKGVYDESDYIRAVVELTNADATFLNVKEANLFDTVDEMLGFHDEPVCTVTWYSLFLISKMMRDKGVPVILNGHGGDELAAGYWDYYQYYFHDLAQSGRTEELERETASWKANHGRPESELVRYRSYMQSLMNGTVDERSRFADYSDCFTPDFVQEHRQQVSMENPFREMLNRRMYSDLIYETVPASLRAEDRNTMSQSLESRSPFLDYRLIEFCFRLPSRYKIRGGIGKWILREAMKSILPESVRTRKDKAGFIAPAHEWFRGPLYQKLLNLSSSSIVTDLGIFNRERLTATIQEHKDGRADHQMFLWQFVNFVLWFEKFFAKAKVF